MKNLITTALIATLPAAALADETWRDDFVEYIVSDNPSTIVSASFTGVNSLWVAARDNGSNRDGFADYICLELARPGIVVTVWDASAMARDELKRIGRANCR